MLAFMLTIIAVGALIMVRNFWVWRVRLSWIAVLSNERLLRFNQEFQSYDLMLWTVWNWSSNMDSWRAKQK